MATKRKPPIIRKGQKKPFKKATAEEVEERVEFTSRLVIRMYSKTEIHKCLKEKFDVEWRMVDIYIARAKKFLQKQANMSRDDAKQIGVNTLLDVMRTGKPSERTSAERRLAEIFGYDAPRQFRVTTPEGQPFEVKDNRPLEKVPTQRLIELATETARN